MDWDIDGKKDLITGEGAGYVRIYLNINTDENPVFSSFQNLAVNGTSKDFGNYSAPDIVDWNNDGKKDILVGEALGYVYLHINTNTDADPVFTSSVRLQNGSSDLKVTGRSAPKAFDWNLDGKKDLLLGTASGRIYCFDNQGSNESPVFDGHVSLQSAGSDLNVVQNAVFDVADWTNDGLEDIICGCYYLGHSPTGCVLYFHAMYMPKPDATINGEDGPLDVPASTLLEFKIALDPGDLDGVACDWWVWIEKWGNVNKWWCQYNGGNKKWIKKIAPQRFAGAPLQVVNGYKVLGPRTIPAGTYYFRFAIDEKNDEYEGTYIDEVRLTTY